MAAKPGITHFQPSCFLFSLEQKKAKLERKTSNLKTKMEITQEKLNRMGKDRNSFGNTDPDATLMLMKNESLGVGYNIQMATENQVIVGFGVNQRPNDNRLLQPMIEEVTGNFGKKPEIIMADKGYCSQSNYEYVSREGIKAAIPPNTFALDMPARHRGLYHRSRNEAYEDLKVAMLDFLDTAEGKKLIDLRKHDIEPTFGDIKHNMGFRKLHLRRLAKVTTEVGLIAIAIT